MMKNVTKKVRIAIPRATAMATPATAPLESLSLADVELILRVGLVALPAPVVVDKWFDVGSTDVVDFTFLPPEVALESA